ncbi:MAG: hypothetical protein GDA55_03940 [Cellvibrionales bacterium]|nr:hypothetical protein [Cellvibrionales bacterium]
MGEFKLGECYTRQEIRDQLGGGDLQSYLPTMDGKVIAACVRCCPCSNPNAPYVILPGWGPKIERTAKQFASQIDPVPAFTQKRGEKRKHVGYYRVKRQSFDEQEIERHAIKAHRAGDVSSVLFLERVDASCTK